MSPLLNHIDLMTSQRDRADLDAALVNALFELSGAMSVRLFKLQKVEPQSLVGLAAERNGDSFKQYDDGISGPEGTSPIQNYPLLEKCLQIGSTCSEQDAATKTWRHAFLVGQRKNMATGLVEISSINKLESETKSTVGSLIHIFDNCNSLLDYCEVDTLTGLLNRKTFDEYLFKILSHKSVRGDGAKAAFELKRRKSHPVAHSHWIGILDIDHFKLINDGFGHAIGDEVLLMLANQMRTHFRVGDKLFRFGGEEFVLLLKPTEIEHAHAVFDRFRHTVEHHKFPQIGNVTVSIGFDRLEISDDASESLENADRALYWAKENGRNRVCFYQSLIKSGDLQKIKPLPSEVEFF